MTHKVTLATNSSISVKIKSSPKIKIRSNTEIQVPANFRDLSDFDDTNKHDQYVIMYNATSNTYNLVNPDQVLSSAAVDELIQPGLPADFKDKLDVDLDNKIDLDAGTF
jgi:hypothetical protein